MARRGLLPRKGRPAKQKQTGTGKYLTCQECSVEESWVDGDITAFTCASCMVRKVPGPPVKKKPTEEELKLKADRKAERDRRKAARAAGLSFSPKDLGFTRGWHLRLTFKTEIEGKVRYFSKGKEIDKKAYTKLAKSQEKKQATLSAKPKYGKGWHFKVYFKAPDGKEFSRGKLVKGARARAAAKLAAKQAEKKVVKKDGTAKPRGWHFKIYYKHTDGKEYSYGKPVKGKDLKLAKLMAKKQAANKQSLKKGRQ